MYHAACDTRRTPHNMSMASAAVDAADVVIIGAGPAGSLAAFRLARAGARVALVDGSHPR